ncbi:MAG: AAA family ATPase [Candidatus Pacebacteria bacterium]|nr:AAA family ATPase [Candidatus Paceibacterota bacterium]
MIVKKVKEIKNVDAFDSFNWLGDDLKKHNLIYGWNGSGKTTISRLFNFLERKAIHIPDLTSVEFTVQTDAGTIKQNNIANHELNVRVFNEDFIKENLLFEESQAKKIVILGKENVETKKEIEALDIDYKAKQKSIEELEEAQGKLPKLDAILTEAGRQVPQNFTNTPLANDTYYGRSYNKNKVDKRIESGVVSESSIASLIIADQADVDAKKDIIKNEKKEIKLNVATIPDFSELFGSANGLLCTTINVQEIKELKDDKDLRDWVETGYKLHKDRALTECQFCKSSLPGETLTRLGSFFTDELQKTKKQIEDAIISLENDDYNGIALELESSALFPEPAKEYTTAKKELEEQVKKIKEVIGSLTDCLKNKKDNLHDCTKKHSAVIYPKDAIDKANVSLEKIKSIITEHNKKVATISEEVKNAAEKIELHIIASILSDKQYFQNKKENERIAAEIAKLKVERGDLIIKIQSKKASLHNATDAVDKINAILKEFFGESHIYLEVTESEDGDTSYVLKRRNKDAKHLSEGEEGVLALVYFLIKLEEDGCNKENCLIVVDDPVDSQDSIFLFRTAGLIKRQLKNVGQLIVLTHNFEFFNLMRDWFLSKQLENDSWMYLISLDKENTTQEVKVENLPDLLKEYKSEYQYLFCRLYQFANNIRPLDEPLVANIARKVLEFFSGFKWSCRTTEDFTSIVLNRFVADPNHLKKGTGDFVVKFLHEYSHGQDFSRPISAAMLEGKSIAKNVLKFIELADKEHYDDIKALCTPATTTTP